MRFETEFFVPGAPEDVIQLFADLPRMAPLMPGAAVGAQNPDGTYAGSLMVKIGPKKLVFKGTLRNDVDIAARSGTLSGRGGTDMRAAKLAGTVDYTLAEHGDASEPTTRVQLISNVELFGILADLADTLGKGIANAMLDEFGRRFAASYGDGSEGADIPAPSALGAGQLTRIVAQSTWESIKKKVSGSNDD